MAILKPVTIDNKTVKVSYPCCGGTKEIEVNFEELERKEALKVSCKYPDLYTQAIHAIRGIENHKDGILRCVTELFAIEGEEIICTQLDSIYNHLMKKHREMIDSDGEMTIDDFSGVMNYVYCSLETAKLLLKLYQSQEYINDNVRELEYAQDGVLV